MLVGTSTNAVSTGDAFGVGSVSLASSSGPRKTLAHGGSLHLSERDKESWLVTGGSGSFGHAFVKLLLNQGAGRVVVFSRDELKQAEMRPFLPTLPARLPWHRLNPLNRLLR